MHRWLLLIVLIFSCMPIQAQGAPPCPKGAVCFAVIGDYGSREVSVKKDPKGGKDEDAVATMVKSWKPEFIITMGDNNYDCGSAQSISGNIGHNYCDFIYNPQAQPAACTGAAANAKTNAFFPSLGNHDWYSTGAAPYLGYFTGLPQGPGAGRYYDFVKGPVHLFALDSQSTEAAAEAKDQKDCKSCGGSPPCQYEPNGASSTSQQAAWLKAAVAKSTAPWKLAFFHAPPYSCDAGSTATWMRWPFEQWGINGVLAGHHHTYERIIQKDQPDFPYIENGVGGIELTKCKQLLPGEVSYSALGAMYVVASATEITFQYFEAKSPSKAQDTCVLSKTSKGQKLACH